MNGEAEKIMTAELGPGEKLAWAGRPRRGIQPTAADILLIPFSLFWCGFVVVWEKSALQMRDGEFFVLFGLILVGTGVYLLVGRFVADSIRRGKTFYGLTNQRVIITSGVFSREVRSLQLSSLGDLSLSERADRSGTITLGSVPGLHAWAARMMPPSWPGASRYLPPALEMIENARDVHDKIRSLRGR